MVSPHGKKALYGVLHILNKHEPPIRFKATINKQKLISWMQSYLKNPEN